MDGGKFRDGAVAIGAISSGAGASELRAARGLRVLPDGGVGDAAGGEGRRGERAAGSGRAGVLRDPQRDVVEVIGAGELGDVPGGGDVGGAFRDGLPAGVDAGSEAEVGEGFGEGKEKGGLLRQEAATLFLVEKKDAVRREVLGAGYKGGVVGFGLAKCLWRGAVTLGGKQFGIEFAVPKQKKAETGAEQGVAVTEPGGGGLFGRSVEPVASKSEVAAERGQGSVAGVVVAIEADGWRGLGEGAGGQQGGGQEKEAAGGGQAGREVHGAYGRTLAWVGVRAPACAAGDKGGKPGFGQVRRRPGCANFGSGATFMATNVPSMQPDPRYPLGRFARPEGISEDDRLSAIGDLAELPSELHNAVHGLGPEQLNTPYRDGGWTVKQLVHHIADSHTNAVIRVKLALTEDWPIIKPYDENAWARLHDSAAPVEWSLDLIESLHARWVMLLQSLDEAQWKRGFRHPERGEMTVEAATLLYAWHSRHHAAHITHLRRREEW